MSDSSEGDMTKNTSQQDDELDDAFARLEKQVEENKQSEQSLNQNPSESPKQPISRKVVKEPPRSGGGFLGVMSLLFAFVALGIGSYGAYSSWVLNQNVTALSQTTDLTQSLASQMSRVESQVTSLQANQASSNDSVQAELDAFSSQQLSEAKALEDRMVAGIAELRQEIGTTSEDWLLAEAEYLLRLANQRVLMEEDVSGAISLFEAADQIISEAEGVVAFSLREAIANDIAALRATSATDIDGIFVQLGAIARQIPQLKQKQLEFVMETSEPTPASGDLTFIQQVKKIAVQLGVRLASLVDYRREGEVVTPILPPGEEYYLKQNLLLKVQLGQLGLLRGNQQIFEQSLVDATSWVNQYFDSSDARTASVQAGLQKLSSMKVERDVPDVSTSLREIRKLMANFHQAEQRSDS
jgi:uroporphyrin-3 C-methyltransferase